VVEFIHTFDFDGKCGGLTAGFVGHLDLVQSGLIWPDIGNTKSGVPRIGTNWGLDAASRQWSSVKEPFDSRVWMRGESDVDVDARSRPSADHVVKSLIVIQHWQFCHTATKSVDDAVYLYVQ